MQTPAGSRGRRQPRRHGRLGRPAFARAGFALFALAAIPLLSHLHTDGAGGAPWHATTTAEPATAELVPPTDSALRIVFLDVGQGDAVLIQAPEGQTALVDAGPRNVVPLLRQLGVERIDLLVATHPHADHIGGMAQVIESLPVRFYMDNGDPHTTQTYQSLLAALDSRPDITYLEAVPRTISLGSASIEVLPLLPRGTAGLNDRSVALVVSFGDFKAFLSGDSEVRQLSHLVGQRAVPDVALLKAAHHGSDNGFTREFLRAAAPEVVVISVGRNGYGHPRPEALAAYTSAGAAVMRTDMHGQVEVLGYGDGRYDVVPAQQVETTPTGETLAADEVRPAVQLRLWVHADAPGDDHENLNGEYAVLESGEEADRALDGWRLCDAANHCFRFPPGTVLAAGGRIVVYTGPGQADGERYYMGYRRAVWNNTGDTATLYDQTGAAAVVVRY